jgi:hypothetical protein
MFELLRSANAELLSRRAYLDDFYRVFAADIHRFDKLERRQNFQEPGVDSWEAFRRGDWPAALSLIEQDRPALTDYYEEMRERGLTARRVRVVDYPISPYLQWELHILRLRAELGESIRVVEAGALHEAEGTGLLPELVILGTSVMYEVRYTDSGIANGARRFSDARLVQSAAASIDALHARGEDLLSFFPREVAPLPPPG